ncbi:FolC protein [Helicobacter aurati]|uniref:FolC protein n=2 Tax=Helicobacter aurati TaxID=137778 RepID=A0A3D8J5T8_9HELI|nr:FolC protein [Helicobacter aurati]
MESKEQEYTRFEPQRVRRIFAKLQHHLQLSSFNIHIIGTNGKGSTGRFIAQSLFESGYHTLHFTSPHLFDFTERFYVDDSIVDLQELEKAHLFLQQFDFINEASYFEYATFLAFVLAGKCDFLIMEAGVGGEYDSTSVLDYDITVFTRIGIDHKDLLGKDLQDIAITKIRAAQGEIFVHFQEDCVLQMFANLSSILNGDGANVVDTQIGAVHYLSENDIMRQEIQCAAQQYHFPIFLQENLALANLVIEHISKYRANAHLTCLPLKLRGRCEILNNHIMLDVGHNEMAAKAVLYEMQKFSNTERFILVYNSYKGKEVLEILQIFRFYIEKIVIFEVDNPRILEQQLMMEIINGLNIKCELFTLSEQAMQSPKHLIESKIGFLESTKKYLVFGSFSLVENFLLWYQSRV